MRVAWNETPRLAVPLDTQVRTRGDTGIAITLDGKKLFGRDGLRLATFDDPFGSWGNHNGDHHGDDISTVLASWQVAQTKVLEKGPLHAVLWVMLTSGTSRLELSFPVDHGARHVAISARLLWNERSARLKLLMPGAGNSATFDVPGGEVTRGPIGEVPGGRWVRADAGRQPFVFASDALYNFDLTDEILRATVVRSTRYARNSPAAATDEPWRPHQDLGEHCFKFAIGEGWIVRVQGKASKSTAAVRTWLGERIVLGRIDSSRNHRLPPGLRPQGMGGQTRYDRRRKTPLTNCLRPVFDSENHSKRGTGKA